MANDSQGYYALLKLEPGASVEDVKLAYGFLKYESEKEGKAPDRKLQEAYDCLSDPQRKIGYDATEGDVSSSARKRLVAFVAILIVLLLFAGFVFPGFLRPAPDPFSAGDRLVHPTRGPLGEVVRREQAHRFAGGLVAPGYLIRDSSGSERWYPASDLERHFTKQ